MAPRAVFPLGPGRQTWPPAFPAGCAREGGVDRAGQFFFHDLAGLRGWEFDVGGFEKAD